MTYGWSLLGGMMIGAAAVWLLFSTGRVAGISGIAGRAAASLRRSVGSHGEQPRELWPWLFIVGLGIGGWMAYLFTGLRPAVDLDAMQSAFLIVGGLLVGYGTRMGSGCTSGHGVCGVSRFSTRSIVATLVYLSVGMLVATLLGMLVPIGGAV